MIAVRMERDFLGVVLDAHGLQRASHG
jgi:hypothetical protein